MRRREWKSILLLVCPALALLVFGLLLLPPPAPVGPPLSFGGATITVIPPLTLSRSVAPRSPAKVIPRADKGKGRPIAVTGFYGGAIKLLQIKVNVTPPSTSRIGRLLPPGPPAETVQHKAILRYVGRPLPTYVFPSTINYAKDGTNIVYNYHLYGISEAKTRVLFLGTYIDEDGFKLPVTVVVNK